MGRRPGEFSFPTLSRSLLLLTLFWGVEPSSLYEDECLSGLDVAMQRMTPWQRRLGTPQMAINPDHLLTVLESRVGRSSSAQGHHGDGIWHRFREIQPAIRRRGLVKDKGAIPDNEIESCPSCSALHPGLCASRDSTIYDLALKVAQYLERHFTDDLKGSFHLIHGFLSNGTCVYYQYVYFAHKRRRGRNAPISHMFCHADLQEVLGPVPMKCLVLRCIRPKKFDWATPWALAKAGLELGCERLTSAQVRLECTR